MKLTPYDNLIYSAFREDFPDMKVDKIDEEKDLKSFEAKAKWRKFIEKFDKLEDFNFGTLLRADASKELFDNSILVVRIQFLAIEIARNREGCNDGLRQKFVGKQDI